MRERKRGRKVIKGRGKIRIARIGERGGKGKRKMIKGRRDRKRKRSGRKQE